LGNKHKIVSPAIVENYEIQGPQPVTTVQTQELLQVATANTLTEDLDALYDCLHGKDANYTVVSSKCAAGAVCWNWVFFGGQTDFAEDPSWAYLYVQSNLTTLNKLGVTDNVKRLLDDAKKEISGRSPNRIPAVTIVYSRRVALFPRFRLAWCRSQLLLGYAVR
jgi:hypothetical protein